MIPTTNQVGAVLTVALLLLLSVSSASALASVPNDQHQIQISQATDQWGHRPAESKVLKWALPILVLLGIGATVSLTYLTPSLGPGVSPSITLGGTVPPTAAQAANINVLVVEASTADGDTSIALVHNWGLSAADLAAGYPLASAMLDTSGTATPVLTGRVTGSAANTLTITKASAAGSGGTIVFHLQRPHTIVR